MSNFSLNFAAQAALGLIAGLAVGGAYFASLWWNTQLFTSGSSGWAVALQFARVAAAVTVLILLARYSLITFVFAGLGLMAARFSLVRGFGEPR